MIFEFAAAAKSLVVSDSVRPHRWQPTRLHGPWDSPGKNTGVGCHCLLQGRDTANKKHWRVLTLSQPHWVCPRSRHLCFPCLHCLGSRLLCQELSEAGPGLYALFRSKPLRFRYSGSSQRCRLSCACVLCPSQVQAAHVTRCLASAVTRFSG